MTYEVRLEQVTSIPLAVVRRRAQIPELSQVVPAACGEVWNVIRALDIPSAGRNIAVYWDEVINLEVGVELDAPFTGHGEVVRSATPAGRVAVTTHFGPYQNLASAHNAVRDWCQANGQALAGPNWELYGHWLDEWNRDPSKIRTDVYYLVSSP
jgi:effector-binding domain-containing protein